MAINHERTYDPDGDCVAGLSGVPIVMTNHDGSSKQADAVENPRVN